MNPHKAAAPGANSTSASNWNRNDFPKSTPGSSSTVFVKPTPKSLPQEKGAASTVSPIYIESDTEDPATPAVASSTEYTKLTVPPAI